MPYKEHHEGEQLLPEFDKMISRAVGIQQGKFLLLLNHLPKFKQPN